MAACLGNSLSIGLLERRIIIGVDGGGDIAVQDALNILSLIELRIIGIVIFLIPIQVQQHIDEVIGRRILDILEPDRDLLIAVKIIRFDFDRRILRIIDRATRNPRFVRLRRRRSRDGIRQVLLLHLLEVGVKDYFISIIRQIIVFRRDVIHVHFTEHRHDGHIVIDHCFGSNHGACILVNPLLENLSGYEGILRHGANGLACITEILKQALDDRLTIHDHEGDGIGVRKDRRQGQVGSDRFTAFILGRSHKPADEGLALHHGVGMQGQGVAGIIGIGSVSIIADFIGNGKDVLGVFGPDIRIGLDSDAVAEVSALAIDPLADVTGIDRQLGDIVQAIGGIDVDGFLRDEGLFIRIRIEFDRIGFLRVTGDDVEMIVINRIGKLDRCPRGPRGPLATGRGDAPTPIAIIILTGRYGGKITDFAKVVTIRVLFDLIGIFDFAVTIAEANGPVFHCFFVAFICGQKHRLIHRLDDHAARLGDDRFGGHRFLVGGVAPLDEFIALGLVGIGQIAERGADRHDLGRAGNHRFALIIQLGKDDGRAVRPLDRVGGYGIHARTFRQHINRQQLKNHHCRQKQGQETFLTHGSFLQ